MADIVSRLLAGNERHSERVSHSFDDLRDGQQPDAVTVSCGDSRVLQDEMWDNAEPGQIFTHSCLGNRVTRHPDGEQFVTGDVLYPLLYAGTETAIVVGHTGCGAVTATYEYLTDGRENPAGIGHCIDVLSNDLRPGVELLPEHADDAAVNRLVEYNVDRQVEHLVESDAVPTAVDVVGAVYDFHGVYSSTAGRIRILNVDGERDPSRLRENHPEMAPHVGRKWSYW